MFGWCWCRDVCIFVTMISLILLNARSLTCGTTSGTCWWKNKHFSFPNVSGLFSTCLNSILKGTCQKEEGCRMLEPLFSQQRKGIFQCSFPPPVLAEVVTEELCHFCILLRPGENDVIQHNKTAVSGLQWSDTIYKGRGKYCVTVRTMCAHLYVI